MTRGRRPFRDMRTMKALFDSAEASALQAGEPKPGAEYLVLAALDLPDGSARRAFERIGANPDQFRSAIAGQHAAALRAVGIESIDDSLDGQIPAPSPPRGPLRTAPSAQKVFRKVVKLVRKEKSELYGAYIVLVAAQAEHGTTARALRHMGVDPEALGAAARTELDALKG